MDARQRLNQLRRFKSKSIGNRKKQRLNDLRELIDRNDNKIIKINRNNRNSVKNRIQLKGQNQKNRLELFTNKRRGLNSNTMRADRLQTNKRIITESQRMPTVMVDLSRIDDNRSLPSSSGVRTQSMYSSGSARNSNTVNESKTSVLVSNLNQTITDSDVKELFGEIGPIVRSSKVNSSVALIVYHNEVDARKACNTYHNRLLDGLPMQCNTLNLSDNEYAVERQQPVRQTMETQPIRKNINPRKRTTLLDSQLRQINAIPQQMSGQRVTNKRFGRRSNTRFVVNV